MVSIFLMEKCELWMEKDADNRLETQTGHDSFIIKPWLKTL